MLSPAEYITTVQDFDFWLQTYADGATALFACPEGGLPTAENCAMHPTYEEAWADLQTLLDDYEQRRAKVEASQGSLVMIQDYVLDEPEVVEIFKWLDDNVGEGCVHDNGIWLPIFEFADPADAFHFKLRWSKRAA